MLEAKNPLAAMQKNENGFNMASHYGAIVEILPDAATEKVLLSDMRILEATASKRSSPPCSMHATMAP